MDKCFIDEKVLKYYEDTCSKVGKNIKRELDSEPVYNN